MKLLITIQLFVYLIISPMLLAFFEKENFYRFDISLVAIFSFLLGMKLCEISKKKTTIKNEYFSIKIPRAIYLLISIFSIFYIHAIISNDLLERRLGSETMALLYANLSLVDLLIIRLYEVLFYPLIIIIIYEVRKKSSPISVIGMLLMALAFLFTGVIDSRAKLITPILLFIMFFPRNGEYSSSLKFLKSKYLLIAISIAIALIALNRISEFGNLQEYIINDIVKRVDGLELVSLVSEEINISPLGEYDFYIFSNFISIIPFFDAANALKEAGLTSSKNYLLTVILDLQQLDINNTFVTDLFYFGGYPFLFLGSGLIGFFSTKFDYLIRSRRWLSSKHTAAFIISFGINGFRIEQDFFAMLIAIARDFLIIYSAYTFIRFQSKKSNRTVGLKNFEKHENLLVLPG